MSRSRGTFVLDVLLLAMLSRLLQSAHPESANIVARRSDVCARQHHRARDPGQSAKARGGPNERVDSTPSQRTFRISNRASAIDGRNLQTIVDSDTIFVMSAGKIVERGSHSELLDLNGIYASLWKRQIRYAVHSVLSMR